MQNEEIMDCIKIKQEEEAFNLDIENDFTNFENDMNTEFVRIASVPRCRIEDTTTTDPARVDDEKLKRFLRHIDMEAVYKHLKASQVTYRSLQYLKEEDLKEAIPPLGLRVEFREKLSQWKNNEFDYESSSMPSKVAEWLHETSSEFMTSQQTTHFGIGFKGNLRDVKTLLLETMKGRSVMEYSQQHGELTMHHRNAIVDIIIEDIIFNNIVLKPSDFVNILGEICAIFPHEKQIKDFYYVPRKGKNNASGRLYSKYKTIKFKRRKEKSTLASRDNVEGEDENNST